MWGPSPRPVWPQSKPNIRTREAEVRGACQQPAPVGTRETGVSRSQGPAPTFLETPCVLVPRSSPRRSGPLHRGGTRGSDLVGPCPAEPAADPGMALWACLSPGRQVVRGCEHRPVETRRLGKDPRNTEETCTIPCLPFHLKTTSSGQNGEGLLTVQPPARPVGDGQLPFCHMPFCPDLRAMQTQGHLVDSCCSQPSLGGLPSSPGTQGPRALHPGVSRTSVGSFPPSTGAAPSPPPGLAHTSPDRPVLSRSLPPRPWNFPPAHAAGYKAVIELNELNHSAQVQLQLTRNSCRYIVLRRFH